MKNTLPVIAFLGVSAAVLGLSFLSYNIGYHKGADYGVATSNLMWENDVYNHGCGDYYVENREAKFRWKDCK